MHETVRGQGRACVTPAGFGRFKIQDLAENYPSSLVAPFFGRFKIRPKIKGLAENPSPFIARGTLLVLSDAVVATRNVNRPAKSKEIHQVKSIQFNKREKKESE